MQNVESKMKLLGEVLVILAIQIVMMLFRLVEPIQWPSIFPGKYVTCLNEVVYFGIEMLLLIVVIAHFIFQITYKELGLVRLKENIGVFILNGCYLGAGIGVAYVMSLFSKNIEIYWDILICQVMTNFIAIAFLKELIFRGFLMRALLSLTNGKGIIASLISAVCFSLTYLPAVLVSVSEVSSNGLLQVLAIPFAMGLLLSLMYYYTKNLWLCITVHGVLITLLGLQQDFAVVAVEVFYAVCLVIYLIIKMVRYYKGERWVDEANDADDEMGNMQSECDDTVSEEKPVELDYDVQTGIKEEETIIEIDYSKATKQNIELKDKEVEIQKKADMRVETQVEANRSGYHFSKKILNELDDLQNELKRQVKSSHGEDLDRTVIMPAIPEDPKELEDFLNSQQATEQKDESVSGVRQLTSILSIPLEEEEEIQEIIPQFSETVLAAETSSEQSKEEIEQLDNDPIEQEPNYIAHLEKYLGEFEGIYKEVAQSHMPIDILYFKGDKVNALVTNGMRSLPMNVPEEFKDYQNVELMMYVDKCFDLSNEGMLQSENAWMLKILSELASYPSMTNSYLGWGHIVGNGDTLEAYDESVAYCGAMVYPSIYETDINFSHYQENGVKVFIYNVMPLYKEELEFIQQRSSEQFANLMVNRGVNQVVTPRRIHVVKNQ